MEIFLLPAVLKSELMWTILPQILVKIRHNLYFAVLLLFLYAVNKEMWASIH